MHWVLLFGTVQEQERADVASHHGKGPVRELIVRHGYTRKKPGCLTTACPIADIFVLIGNISGRGWGRGRRGRAGRCRSPRNDGGGGSGAAVRNRDGRREMRIKAGSSRRKKTATLTPAAQASGRKSATDYLQVRQHIDRAGGKYPVDGTDQKDSADKSAEWSGEETEGLAMEEEVDIAGGAREVVQALTVTAQELEGICMEAAPGGAAAGGGDTWDVTSENADEAGAGFRHWEKQRGRERVAGQREKHPSGESYGMRSREGGPEVSVVA